MRKTWNLWYFDPSKKDRCMRMWLADEKRKRHDCTHDKWYESRMVDISIDMVGGRHGTVAGSWRETTKDLLEGRVNPSWREMAGVCRILNEEPETQTPRTLRVDGDGSMKVVWMVMEEWKWLVVVTRETHEPWMKIEAVEPSLRRRDEALTAKRNKNDARTLFDKVATNDTADWIWLTSFDSIWQLLDQTALPRLIVRWGYAMHRSTDTKFLAQNANWYCNGNLLCMHVRYSLFCIPWTQESATKVQE